MEIRGVAGKAFILVDVPCSAWIESFLELAATSAVGHNRKSVMATAMSAFGGKAEVDFGWLEVCL